MLMNVISTLGGALFGAGQKYFDKKLESEHQLKMQELQNAHEIAMAEKNLFISNNNVEISQNELSKSDNDVSSNRINASVSSTAIIKGKGTIFAIINFLNGTTRPIITYLGFGLMLASSWAFYNIVKEYTDTKTGIGMDLILQTLLNALEMVFITVEAWIGYWFANKTNADRISNIFDRQRNSFEKINDNIESKKKMIK